MDYEPNGVLNCLDCHEVASCLSRLRATRALHSTPKRVLRRDFKDGKPDEWKEKRQRTEDGWQAQPTHNDAFNEYYQGQKICPPEEWDAFLDALRKPLPTTFRINGSGKFAKDLRDRLQSDFLSQFSNAPLEIDGESISPPAPLEWYPENLAWSFSFSRTQLRKVSALEALHDFMKRETAIGAISRQEAVSMVPPLFLDVQPGHRVLDMCAAPGSKTFQLLEALHAGPAGEGPAGLVIANDADAQRCNLLTHQTKRMCSPALLVTNHEAQHFPTLLDWSAAPASAGEGLPAVAPPHILYDRILADVPCSGDGTIRKAPDIWRRWTPGNGNGLHTLQLRIALRAAELLAVGGRMVYSTCTFNPVEDEAVVAELLRRAGGALRILDVAGEVPGLKRLPGLPAWRVRDREAWYERWAGEGEHGYKLAPSMFPGEGAAELGLERCMRFLPHHQDTGGFFVAVVEKVTGLAGRLEYPISIQARKARAAAAPGPKDAEEGAAGEAGEPATEEAGEFAGQPAAADAGAEEPADAGAEEPAEPVDTEGPTPKADEEVEVEAAEPALGETAAEDPVAAPAHAPVPTAPVWGAVRGGGGRNREAGGKWHGIDPIVPFTDPEQLASMRSFYGMAPGCPIPDALIARSVDPKPKRLSYVSSGVKHLLMMDVKESLKITAAGVKVFERQESKDGLVGCIYRVAQEGLPILLPFLSAQTLSLGLPELLCLLRDRSLLLPEAAKVHISRRGPEAQAPASSGAPEPASVDAMAAVEPSAEAREAGSGAGVGQAAAAPKDGTAEAPDSAAAEPAEHVAAAAAPRPAAPRLSTLDDPQAVESMKSIGYGCCIATLRASDATALGLSAETAAEGALTAAAPIAVACWRGRASLNVLVSKQECSQMEDRLTEAKA